MIISFPWYRARSGYQRAIMLIVVLWIVTLLSLLVYSLLFTLTLETRITSVRKKTQQAEGVARAGIARGFVDLRNDLIADNSDEEVAPFDAEGDYWADPEEGKTDEEFGDGVYNVEIIDQERFLSLSALSGTNKILLEKIIEDIGYSEEDAKIAAAAIIDYADTDETPLLDNPASDKEGLAYGILIADDAGLSTREDEVEEVHFANEAYWTTDSLLEVYGVTPELYFGPGTPEAAQYRELMGLSTNKKKARGERFHIDKQRRGKDEVYGLRDYFTAISSGSVNLNTAPKQVLTALFWAAGRDDGDRAAEDVIRYRGGGEKRNIDNDSAFKSVEDFKKCSALASVLDAVQANHPLTTVSSTFRIRSTGTVGGVNKTLQVLVTRELIEIQRKEDFKYLERARERRERYPEKRKRWEDKDNAELIRIPSIYVKRWEKN